MNDEIIERKQNELYGQTMTWLRNVCVTNDHGKI
jgi:hypothetical protein